MFRTIVFTAVLVGLVVGIAISAVQFLGTSPLILKAEVFERSSEVSPSHVHEHGAAHDHQHGEVGWEPADGLERNAYTVAANVLTAIGYAMALAGLIALRGRPVTWRGGLIWGIAGFACVMLAPMLGLPPELPGTPVAPLGERQVWWVGTVVATGVGLALIAFHRRRWAAALAVGLICLPHIVGAPMAPEGEPALAPDALEHRFVVAAVVTSLIFWSLLGSFVGAMFQRFEAKA